MASTVAWKTQRGPLVFNMAEYLEATANAEKPMPKAIVLEQSKTLAGRYKEILDQIKARLKKLEYRVDVCIMDTLKHGLPQSREHTYLVSYKMVHKFNFPEPLKTVMPIEEYFSRWSSVWRVPLSQNVNGRGLGELARGQGSAATTLMWTPSWLTLTLQIHAGSGGPKSR